MQTVNTGAIPKKKGQRTPGFTLNQWGIIVAIVVGLFGMVNSITHFTDQPPSPKLIVYAQSEFNTFCPEETFASGSIISIYNAGNRNAIGVNLNIVTTKPNQIIDVKLVDTDRNYDRSPPYIEYYSGQNSPKYPKIIGRPYAFRNSPTELTIDLGDIKVDEIVTIKADVTFEKGDCDSINYLTIKAKDSAYNTESNTTQVKITTANFNQ